MPQLDMKKISDLSEDKLSQFAEFDAAGIFPCPGETLSDFKARLLLHAEVLEDFESTLKNSGEYTLFDNFKLYETDRIDVDIINEATAITERLYRFSISWVPGFFLSRSIGWLWGGYAIHIPEEHITVFLIRKVFKYKPKWFIYRRDELLSHELCHAARSPLRDRQFEEYFAYQTAPSIIRRYIGNCFRTQLDAVLFLVPVLILLVAQMLDTFTSLTPPIWLLWITALIFPGFLFVRNQYSRNCYKKASSALSGIGVSGVDAVLFRCTSSEIMQIAKFNNDKDGLRNCLEQYIAKELRWKIIQCRFINLPDDKL